MLPGVKNVKWLLGGESMWEGAVWLHWGSMRNPCAGSIQYFDWWQMHEPTQVKELGKT